MEHKETIRCTGLNLKAYSECVAALLIAREALLTLSNHPAFAGDEPEFNEGGVGYRACAISRTALKNAKKG